jgi:putative peptidoglycan lipid II flippase
MTPARATVTALISNILLKVLFVWGLHWGVAGIALGTSLGAWINVAILTWFGHSRALLAIEKEFQRALFPALFAALAAASGAWCGAQGAAHLTHGPLADLAMLLAAMLCGSVAYGVVVLAFRRALPLGRLAK